MQSIEQYQALHTALECSQRFFEGVRAGSAAGGHHGLAAFALHEADERRNYAMQIAHHLEGQNQAVMLHALPAPDTIFDTIEAAASVVHGYDNKVMYAFDALMEHVISAGESPYFIIRLNKKFKYDMKEVKDVFDMLSGASPEQMLEANKRLLKKYSNTGCCCS